MSTSQLVVQHLPYLRRYARALTGSQVAGDAYVAATLETLVNEPDTLGRSTNVKADLFRVFTRIWNSLSVNGRSEQVQHDLPAEVRLGQITPLPRQAFLLSCLEGFSEEDAAIILDVDVSQVRDLVDEAGRELAADMATDILIIEDEPFIAMDLEALVEGLGHNVIGVARTRTEAVKIASDSKRPGLILADIQLADGSSGLDAVNDLLEDLRGAGDLHHRLSGALPHGRAARAGLPHRQAVPAGERLGGHQPGAVLPADGASARGQDRLTAAFRETCLATKRTPGAPPGVFSVRDRAERRRQARPQKNGPEKSPTRG